MQRLRCVRIKAASIRRAAVQEILRTDHSVELRSEVSRHVGISERIIYRLIKQHDLGD